MTTNQQATALNKLLTKAANMSSGGSDWALNQAGAYGLNPQDVAPYVQNNVDWGAGYRTQTNSRQAAAYAPDGSYTYNEIDPYSGLKIFYDENGNPFVNNQ